MARSIQVRELIRFEYLETEPGFFLPGEAKDTLELTYVDRGQLHSVVDGQDLVLRQGELVLYAPGQWRMQYAAVGAAPRIVHLEFRVSGGEFSGLVNRKISLSPNAVMLLRQMFTEKERGGVYSEDMILVSAELLLLTLLREAHAPAQSAKTPYAVHSENEIIRRAQQYVSLHLREKLSVPLVARNVDVSPSYLTALFHKHLELSPGEYIRRVKLQESKRLIREGNLNFTEIAAALNYSTVHHFSRQFKEKFGITPTEYAKSLR